MTRKAKRAAPSERVWDITVRVSHWVLVTAFVIAFFSEGEPIYLHIWAGYAVAAVVVLRMVWGFVGGVHARFSDFLYPPRRVLAYLKDELHLRGKRYLGHNPAGGAMVVAILCMLLVTTVSGLRLYAGRPNSDYFPTPTAGDARKGSEHPLSSPAGDEVWEEVHEVSANLSLVLVLLHIGGVALASRVHKENLIKSMFTGRKRPLP